ncbi:MAG: tyrosine-type recombinase/integrase [Cyanobacteria bacterium P01_E01_bin.6]
MAKSNRNGQAAILSDRDYAAIRNQLVSESHKLFFDIARWTGERWGAIASLRIGDCYFNHYDGTPRDTIVFRASTRKASPDGTRKTRECPIHPTLLDTLKRYRPDGNREDWLFPSKDNAGNHITFWGCDKWFRCAVDKAGLSSKGISTHSTRRTLITRLARKGIDVKTLAAITGHRDVKSLMRYVEVDAQTVNRAIATL